VARLGLLEGGSIIWADFFDRGMIGGLDATEFLRSFWGVCDVGLWEG